MPPGPDDPVERIAWLGCELAEYLAKHETALQLAYFEARLQGRFDDAVAKGPWGRKRASTATRRENESRGRAIRWGQL